MALTHFPFSSWCPGCQRPHARADTLLVKDIFQPNSNRMLCLHTFIHCFPPPFRKQNSKTPPLVPVLPPVKGAGRKLYPRIHLEEEIKTPFRGNYLLKSRTGEATPPLLHRPGWRCRSAKRGPERNQSPYFSAVSICKI